LKKIPLPEVILAIIRRTDQVQHVRVAATRVQLPVHMLLGILVVLSLWTLGIAIATNRGGTIVLGVGALVWGMLVIALGLTQTRLLVDPSVHWMIQILHLLLGVGAIGFGETIARRYRRINNGKLQERQSDTSDQLTA
jgi:hypothetical protein